MLLQKWHLSLMNGIVLSNGNKEIRKFRTQKTGELLAYLAYHLGRAIQREELVDAIWPDYELEAGRASVRTAVSSLRRQLEPPGTVTNSVIISDRSTVALASAAVSTDVQRFVTAYGAYSQLGCTDRLQLALNAIGLYSGDLLPGCYSDWAVAAREEMQSWQSELLRDAAMLTLAAGDAEQAHRYALRLIKVDPLVESSYLLAMKALAKAERYGEALQVFEEWRCVSEREFDLPPSRSAREIARQVECASERYADLNNFTVSVRTDNSNKVLLPGSGVNPRQENTDIVEAESAQIPKAPPVELAATNVGIPLVLTRFFGRQLEA